jgi:hypothetical protein
MNRNDNHPRRTSHRRAAIERYEEAFRALCQNAIDEYAAGTDVETDEYLRVNLAVTGARRGVPWHRRWLADRRVIRELDYWARTGQEL